MKKFKKIISVLLSISISAILFFYLLHQVDRKSLITNIRGANKPLLLVSFLIFLIGYILCLLRWEMLLRAVKIHLPFKRVLNSFAGSMFFSFLPSTVGGDTVRSIDLAMHTKKTHEVLATVFLDRLSGYVGLVSLALLSLGFGWKLVGDKGVLFSVALISSVLAAILLLLFNKSAYYTISRLLHSPNAGKLRTLIKDLHEEMHYFRHQIDVIVDNLIFSLLIQTIMPVSFFIIALSLGLKLNIIYFFIFLPIIAAITLLPISMGGLGVRDAAVVFFFAKAGVNKDVAFAMSLINFFFILLSSAIGGLIYVITIRHRRIQHHKSPSI